MSIEDHFFTRARLGRYWTEAAARACIAFFPAPYQFNADLERQFQASHATDYAEHLLERIATDNHQPA